jgi:hypothetical protein
MVRRVIGLAALVGAGVVGYRVVVEPWWRTWGVAPGEGDGPLPGDDAVPDGRTADTRGITIDAPPEQVWPWLVQMGYGRAGWYSYDRIDMDGASADEILAEHQALAIGDVVPTHPGGGFVVQALEPGGHLVLYLDAELTRQQAEQAGAVDATPANLKLAGAFMEGAQPSDYAASWAFVLEPLEGRRTRLIERFRVRFGTSDRPWMRFTMPLMGFGVFIMMRRQMLGIRERAERTAAGPTPVSIAA